MQLYSFIQRQKLPILIYMRGEKSYCVNISVSVRSINLASEFTCVPPVLSSHDPPVRSSHDPPVRSSHDPSGANHTRSGIRAERKEGGADECCPLHCRRPPRLWPGMPYISFFFIGMFCICI